MLNRRTVIALILGAVIVVGAYWYTNHASLTAAANRVHASETDDLLQAVAKKDTDGDGLPDWEEQLYGTDVSNAHSVDPNLTDSEAVAQGLVKPKFNSDVSGLASANAGEGATSSADLSGDIPGSAPMPGSLTDTFAHAFFEQYMSANGGQPPDEATQQKLITGLVTAFAANTQGIVATHYATSSMRVDDSVAVMTYIDSIETIFSKDDVAQGQGNPLDLIQAAITDGDPTAFKKLATLSRAYSNIASDLSRAPVPSTVSDTHLALIRAFDLMAQSTALAANADRDPLASLAGLSTYATAPKDILAAFTTLSYAIVAAEGTPKTGQSGYMIWSLGRQTTP